MRNDTESPVPGEPPETGDWGPLDWCASGAVGAAWRQPAPGSEQQGAERPGTERRPETGRRFGGGRYDPAPPFPADDRERPARADRPQRLRRGGRSRTGPGRFGADGSGPDSSGPDFSGPDFSGAPDGSGSAGADPAGPGAAEEVRDPAAQARAICLRLLTGSPRTRKQLADALRKRGIPEEAAAEVLSRFEDVGLIDDAAFADAWVESRHTGRGLSRRALARELRTRGVSGAVVEEAVGRLDPEQEADTARALVDRKLRATRGLDRQVRIRRLAGMLARRGYPEGLALRVVREALTAEGEAAEELDRWLPDG